jgi:hypothetical protein
LAFTEWQLAGARGPRTKKSGQFYTETPSDKS